MLTKISWKQELFILSYLDIWDFIFFYLVSGSRNSTYLGDQTGFKFKTPQKVLFVEELTEIMTNNFPEFWKLGQAYVSGTLFMKEVTIYYFLEFSLDYYLSPHIIWERYNVFTWIVCRSVHHKLCLLHNF